MEDDIRVEDRVVGVDTDRCSWREVVRVFFLGSAPGLLNRKKVLSD